MPAIALARPFSQIVRVVVTGLVVLALAACARGPIHGDSKPHPGVDRARAMPIQGIDVARYQGDVDYHAARRAGIRFVFMKATEGGDYLDPMFRQNWNRAREAGMARGAYHFMTWCRPAHEQAAWFKANVPADPDALPPVLDLEWNNHSSCRNTNSREEVLAMVALMLTEMERHTGKLPIIYTDINFHRDILEGVALPNPFWLRSVAAEPHERYNGRGWTFWQWTQTGVVAGIKGDVDRNAFYGTENDWTVFLLTGCDPRTVHLLGPTGRCRSIK